MRYAAGSVQGRRPNNEDAHFVDLKMTKNQSIFAIFDGHGGSDAANYARDNFVNFQMKNELIQLLTKVEQLYELIDLSETGQQTSDERQ